MVGWLCYFWACGEAVYTGRYVKQSKAAHFMVARKQREREGEGYNKVDASRAHSQYLLPPTKPHLLVSTTMGFYHR
jgi:hypothetical protein